MGTPRACARRQVSGFFRKYIRGRGIDIGCGHPRYTKIRPKADGFDTNEQPPDTPPDIYGQYIQGDATYMEGIPDETYDYVYSSHCLEDLEDVYTALRNWWRILKHGGYLILFLPLRDYFEGKTTLPSSGNAAHKHYFLPFVSEPPVTLSVYDLITMMLDNAHIVYLNECCTGESSIEVVVQKGKYTPLFDL